MGINLERVTIEDCIDNYKYKNISVIINDGQIVGFKTEKEKSTTNSPTKAV